MNNRGKVINRLRRKKTNKFTQQLELSNINWEKAEKIFTSNEQFQRKIRNEENLVFSAKDILKILAGGSVIALSFLVPALPMVIAPFILKSNRFDHRYFSQSITRMNNQKLVEIVEENDCTLVRITDLGRVRALRYKLSEVQVKRPQEWDKKWRIVIFDIPEKYKRVRELFRWHLKSMNFYQLQKSVWVHPYSCFDEIEFLRQIYKVDLNITYILAEKLEDSDYLKERFELS